MKSKWSHNRAQAEALRREGNSIPYIEKALGIPRSTLSGWFRNIELTEEQKAILHENWIQGLVKARSKAIEWHRAQKEMRLMKARGEAQECIDRQEISDETIEIALAFLYLGEGSKNNATSLASSNSSILQFFLHAISRLYHIEPSMVKCYLHLRYDQDERVMKRFWAESLNVPESSFGKSSFDKRTAKSPTYETYKGVCILDCGRVAIQRRLRYIAEGFCDKIKEAAPGG